MERATDRYPVPPPRPPSPAVTGTPPHPDGASAHPPTRRPELDRAVAELQAGKAAWTAVGVAERRRLIARLRRDFLAVSERWAAAWAGAFGPPDSGETSLPGPYFVLRNLRLLAGSLADIETHGAPRIAGPVKQRPDGQVVARVFPQDLYDRLFYGGVTAEVWMEPGVTPAGLAATQSMAYRRQDGGGVALVLGARNVSSIRPMDPLYKLFVDDRVVLYKAHPVDAYLRRLQRRRLRLPGRDLGPHAAQQRRLQLQRPPRHRPARRLARPRAPAGGDARAARPPAAAARLLPGGGQPLSRLRRSPPGGGAL